LSTYGLRFTDSLTNDLSVETVCFMEIRQRTPHSSETARLQYHSDRQRQSDDERVDTANNANDTRSSAAAEGPRDAMCQSKSYQLLHNSVGTTCITSPEEIEVMELNGYSRPTCNELCASSHDALDRRKCNPQARPSTSFVSYSNTPPTCRGEIL